MCTFTSGEIASAILVIIAAFRVIVEPFIFGTRARFLICHRRRRHRVVCKVKFMFMFIGVLTSSFVLMDISATDRNPEPGDNPLLFSTDSKGGDTQPQTVMHTTKPLLNQLGTTGICPHRSNQPTQDSSDHESQTLCVSPPSEDIGMVEIERFMKHHN